MRKTFFSVLALCAMKEESDHLKEQLTHNGFSVSRENDQEMFNTNVVVHMFTTGIGIVNSASNATILIHTLRPDMIINTGCAGAHDPSLNRGDVVIGDSTVMTSQVIKRTDHIIPYGDRDLNQIVFGCDNTLVQRVIRTHVELMPWDDSGEPPSIVVGRIASSDTWTDSKPEILKLTKVFETLCEDMEAAAIAAVGRTHEVPVLSIKDISNSVFKTEKAASSTFDAIEHVIPPFAGRNSAALAAAFLGDLASGDVT